MFDAYSRISGRDIEQVIKSEMSGNLEIGMVAIGQLTDMYKLFLGLNESFLLVYLND